MTAYRRPARRCTWRECAQPAATVAFELPNLPAAAAATPAPPHTSQVSMARGAVVVARFGPTSPPYPACPYVGGRPTRRGTRSRKEVVP